MMSKKDKFLCVGAFGAAFIVLSIVALLMLRDGSQIDPYTMRVAWVTADQDWHVKSVVLESAFQEALESSGYSDEIEDARARISNLSLDSTLDPAIAFAVPDYQMVLTPLSMGENYLANEYVDFLVDLSDSQALLDAGLEDHCVCLIDWESVNKAPEGQTDRLLAILEELKG